MHKFRSQARRHAWIPNHDDGSINWNPFARRGPPPVGTDAESVLTEPVRSPTIESESHAVYQMERERHPANANGVREAHTMPTKLTDLDTKDEGLGIEQSPVSSGEASQTSERGGLGSSEEPRSEEPRRRINRRSTEKEKHDENVERSQTTESEKKRKKKHFTFMSQIRGTILNSWINILLVAVPIGIIINYLHVDPKIIFVVNFIAIIPLAGMLSYATEEIALRVGETLGGLLNASFGNAVELIVSILALIKREVLIVQTSLIGSILSNLLLVMGMSFFAGGITRIEQHFNQTVAQTASSLLALSITSLIIPTAFHAWSGAGTAGIKELSRGTAIILLLVYGSYLFFQLKTHKDMYNEPSKKVQSRGRKPKGAMHGALAQIGGKNLGIGGGQVSENAQPKENDGQPEPQLAIVTALVTLGISTVLVALCAEFMVGSIDQLTSPPSPLSKTFVGLILLPIVGNAAEHATAVTVAAKDKMDLAIGVAVGSSMQIALLVIPFIVTLGWIMHIDDMTLYFDGFQVVVLFAAVLLTNYMIADGKSNWLEGVLLMSAYIIIAVAAWFYPKSTE